MSGDGSEKQLGTLASITAGIEATRTEIRSVGIQTSSELYEAQVRLAIPLDRVNNLDRARIDADNAEFVENELQWEMTIEIESVGQTNLETSRSVSGVRGGREDPVDADTGPTDGTKTQAPTPPVNNEGQNGDTEDAKTPPTVTVGSQSKTEPNGEKAGDSEVHDEIPEYQDPERLAAVYDENATFEEMRKKLGVDVTAQTVRKYMIKHGIHEPEPRPDRLLETIRASELELMNSDEDRRPSESDEATNTDGKSK
ncbi:hypothetical protein ABNG02_14295 [Halorubrum ejinorense]|uniref:DUF8073 domain-containing protein n=1 Tax=Halorubrum ejinorense TaxID=425309 RepID=A0AAV3SSC7_9EURY